MPFRIILADDSPLVRAGARLLGAENLPCVDETVSTPNDLFRALEEKHFDVLITDLQLRVVDAFGLIDSIRKQHKDIKIILYSSMVQPTTVARGAAHGCFDVVFKAGNVDKLVHSIQSLENGRPRPESPLNRFEKLLQSDILGWKPDGPTSFTKRELQIVFLLSLGLSNREISGCLAISLETTKEHVQNLLKKFKYSDRGTIGVWAIKNKIPQLEIIDTD